MTLEAFDIREADTPHGIGRQRCADCGTFRLLEADSRCHGCLTFRAVPVKAHMPRPEFRVRYLNWKGEETVADLVQMSRVELIVGWHPGAKVSRINLDGTETPITVTGEL